MNNVGIICDLSYTRHHLFKSYYLTVKNLYGEPRIINGVSDLEGIDLLFIGDDHYATHKDVWMSDHFIDYCNINDIKVVTLTNEKILNSYFPWNADNLIHLRRFKNLYHYANDIDDCIQLGLKLNRTCPSISTRFPYFKVPKKDKVVFVGKVKCSRNSYEERSNLIKQISSIIDIDIFESNIPDWGDYVNLISEYRFVLSPIGNGNFFPMRFYEALFVGAIPIHQVRSNTLDHYNYEKGFKDCIFFEKAEEIPSKIKDCKLLESYNALYMEETLALNLKQDKLL